MEASVQFLYHDLQGSQMQRSRPPKIVGRLTDRVEIVQPPSGLSVLLLPVCALNTVCVCVPSVYSTPVLS